MNHAIDLQKRERREGSEADVALRARPHLAGVEDAAPRQNRISEGQDRLTAATLSANSVLSTANDLSLIVCVKRTARRRFGRETLT